MQVKLWCQSKWIYIKFPQLMIDWPMSSGKLHNEFMITDLLWSENIIVMVQRNYERVYSSLQAIIYRTILKHLITQKNTWVFTGTKGSVELAPSPFSVGGKQILCFNPFVPTVHYERHIDFLCIFFFNYLYFFHFYHGINFNNGFID